MCDLIYIYRYAIIAGVTVAPTLALLGCQIAARDKAVQALCISQGAMFGAVVGLFVGHFFEMKGLSIPIVFISATISFVLGEILTSKKLASRNTLLTALFGALLALGYLFSACFPGVENHMTQVFFGDLATLSNTESFLAIGLGLAAILALTRSSQTHTRASFLDAVFGQGSYSRQRRWDGFSVLSLAVIAISVQLVGFLFTITMLFIPTSLALIAGNAGLRAHLVLSAVTASLAAGVGFHLSLHYTKLPTVPIIVVSLVVLGTGICSGARAFLKKKT